MQGHATETVATEPFPLLIFTVAIFKDVLDCVLTLSVVGIVVVIPLSLIMSAILFVWIQGKTHRLQHNKFKIKSMWKNYLFATATEALPLFGMIPANTILVYKIYKNEKAIIKNSV